MRFLIIFIFLVTNSFANEATDIKNLIINKELKKYDGLTFLDAKNTQFDLKNYYSNEFQFWASYIEALIQSNQITLANKFYNRALELGANKKVFMEATKS